MSTNTKQFALGDAQHSKTKALPSGASTIYSDPVDRGPAADRDLHLAPCELQVDAPALAVGQLADASTMTYLVQHSDDDSTYVTINPSVGVQTGAGGAGAAAATYRYALPSTVKRYVRVGATNSGADDAKDASLTMGLKF